MNIFDAQSVQNMFPCIRTGIELILDDVLAEKEKAKKEKTFEKFVADTTGKFK